MSLPIARPSRIACEVRRLALGAVPALVLATWLHAGGVEVARFAPAGSGVSDSAPSAYAAPGRPAATDGTGSAVTETREHLDVTALGIAADGTDATARLQALLASGFRRLRFPAGAYSFSAVRVPEDSRLLFDPGARVVSADDAPMLRIDGTDVRVEGGEFDGQGAAQSAVAAGPDADRLVVSGLAASAFREAAVAVSGASHAMIRDITVTRSRYGVVLQGARDGRVSGVVASRLGRDGILLYDGADRAVVVGNRIEQWAQDAEDGRAAIHAYGSSGAVVRGNEVRGGAHNAEGIRFRDAPRFLATGNLVDDTGGSGIAVVRIGDFEGVHAGDGVIERNSISRAGVRGISIPYAEALPVAVIGNDVRDIRSRWPEEPGDGVLVMAPGSLVADNTIADATGSGIVAAASGVAVVANRITGATVAGVSVPAGSDAFIGANTVLGDGPALRAQGLALGESGFVLPPVIRGFWPGTTGASYRF